MLLQYLNHSLSKLAFITPSAKSVLRADLLEWAESRSVRDWRHKYSGANVGIFSSDNFFISLVLLLLDGYAKRIILLPSALDHAGSVDLARKAECTCIISDRVEFSLEGIGLADPLPPFQTGLNGHNATNVGTLYSTEWVLSTSGTTKTPKLVSHSLDTLSKSVKRDANKGFDLCWGLFYDLNRFAGIQVYLQSLIGGSSLALPSADTTLENKLAFFEQVGCNAISATPTLWRKILMTPGSLKLQLKLITLGGEIADQSILSALKKAYPLARITHIYASTEAGVGFSVSDGLEGFPAHYLGGTLSSVNLRISQDGILEIKPVISGQKYLGESIHLTKDDGFLSTGDRVQVRDERVFFLGRDSGAINVGGNKVQPEKIEQILLEHPEIAMASVIPKRSGITGSLVEARIVLKAEINSTISIPVLRQWCMDRLDRHEVPAIFKILKDIDTNSTGKLSRKEI